MNIRKKLYEEISADMLTRAKLAQRKLIDNRNAIKKLVAEQHDLKKKCKELFRLHFELASGMPKAL